MKTPEGYEKDDIDKYLDSIGCWHFRTFTGGFGSSGKPDIVTCMPTIISPEWVGRRMGLFAGIEVKREGKVPTVLQERRLREILQAGGLGFWGTADKVISDITRWHKAKT